MTQRRRELESSLPEGSQNLCKYLWQLCLEGGVQLSAQDILFISRAVTDYVQNTADGKHTALKMLNADVHPVSILKSYYQQDFLGDDTRKVKPEDLVEYRGYIYRKTKAIPYHSVDVDDREDNDVCDSCGTRTPVGYCLRTVEVQDRNGRSVVENRCNHCRVSSEQPNVRMTGDQKTCNVCPKLNCEFHPKYVDKTLRPSPQLALKAGAGAPPTMW